MRQRPDVYLLTWPLYFALHVYWPFNQAGRYFAPLLPLLLLGLWRALDVRHGWRLPLLRVLVAAHVAVALGHWLAYDQPMALRHDRDWPDLVQLSESMRADRGIVQTVGGPDGPGLQLQLLLDRPVRATRDAAPVAADVSWLVLPADATPPEGFAAATAAGRYQLLRRGEGPR